MQFKLILSVKRTIFGVEEKVEGAKVLKSVKMFDNRILGVGILLHEIDEKIIVHLESQKWTFRRPRLDHIHSIAFYILFTISQFLKSAL